MRAVQGVMKAEADSGVPEAWIQRHASVVAAGFGVLLALAVLAVFEGVFFALNLWENHRHPIVYTSVPSYNIFDPVLGNCFAPNTTSTQTKTTDGATVFSAAYSSDAFGRRNTPCPANAAPPSHFALFFGCSFTFGTGLPDAETLPAHVARLVPDWHVYNYAFQGYGPNHCLAQLEFLNLREQVGESNGVGVFVFIPDHVRRVVGARKVVCLWPHGESYPCYEWGPDGKIAYKGGFQAVHPWRQCWYRALTAEQFITYSNLDIPSGRSDDGKRLTAAILAAARDRFLAQFPGSRFVVAVYPDHSNPRAYPFRPAEMIPYLEAAGVEVLNYAKAINLAEPGMIIEGDGHPAARAHERLAPLLARDLTRVDMPQRAK